MKKLKVWTIVLIVIALIIGVTYNVLGNEDSRTQLDISDEQDSKLISIWEMSETYNNVYCIEHSQKMRGAKTFSINTKVVINGTTAEFYTKTKGSSYQLSKTVTNEANNVLAAILTNGDIDGKTGVRFGSDSTYTYGYQVQKQDWVYSDAQLGLYEFIDEWISAVGAGEIDGFALTNRALTGTEKTIAESVVAQAQSKATKYSYHITLYVLTTSASAYQSLIVIEPDDPTPSLTEVPVEKVWLDNKNAYNTRPSEITVKLLANDVDTGKTLILNESNKWKGKFTNLQDKDENNKTITYTIEEIGVPGYDVSISGNQTNGYKITNRLKTEISVIKKWEDEDDLDDIRPTSITVKLLANGNDTGRTLILDENNSWTGKFTELYKCNANGSVINYTIQEENVEGYTSTYSKTEDSAGNITYVITNTHKPYYAGYIEITGKVWNDLPDGKANAINGIFDDDESGVAGIKVILREANGKQFDVTYYQGTGENIKYYGTEYVETPANGTYTIRVNYDDSPNVYKLYENSETVAEKLKTAYVEFEYDGMKYTTVASASTGSDTSKAIEDEAARNKMDSTYSTVTSSTQHPDNWDGGKITAVTKDVISFENYSDKETTSREEVLKYCNGDGTYIRTNNNNAWEDIITGEHSCADCKGTGHSIKNYEVDVQIIQNVNLGLFNREQPHVAIFSDLSKVEVTMNGQKYTYLYGVRSDEHNDVELKVKFQNKDTYTYRRPVNPADISYLQEEANKNAMSVLVTYEVTIGNLSSTLPITVHNITNYYDSEYTLNTEAWISSAGEEFNKATYNGDLNIRVEPGHESTPIELTYTVSVEAIRNLLNEEATLNNAVEIESYSTEYGEKTLYAEQRTGGRTGQAYAGYDYNSHPGNAGIFINNDDRLEAAKPEADTDIAPSFVLCKDDDPKILSGIVWEDSNVKDNGERLGNGYYEEGEKPVQNVKVELYEIVREDDRNIVSVKLAKLYDSEGNSKDAVVYTDANGHYAFEGVATSEYFIKTTYGNNTGELGHAATTMDGGTTTVNARNYKSTIITDSTIKNILGKNYTDDPNNPNDMAFSKEDKMWHMTHGDGYSVAVDNMVERLEIEDLQNSNYKDTINMSAYSKPFELQVEFETSGESQVDVNGNIDGVTNELSKLDFGIIERPREDLFVETTITYFEIALANTSIITKGNPTTEILNYAKAMGLNQEIDSGSAAREAAMRRLLVEVDNELIQGATAKIQYETRITNNNELDYDYGVLSDYTNIVNSDITTEYDKYITQSGKANYYYYGDSTGLSEMKATIEYVDYLSKEVGYTNSEEWVNLEASELYNNGLISLDVNNNTSGHYLLRREGNETVTLARGETFTQSMITAKAGIANEEENRFDNSLEIIKIDGKTARTIQESDEGVQVEKKYIPGNYIPGSSSSEQDDDIVDNIITPPTGTNYTIVYVITGFVGLIVICSAIIFIKKKVLTK